MTYPTLTPLFYSVNNIDINKSTDTLKKEAALTLHESFIAQAIGLISTHCNQPLLAESKTFYFDISTRQNATTLSGIEKILPYTFTVNTGTLTMQYRGTLADDWATVSTDIYRVIQRNKNWYLEFWNYTNGYQYRLNLTVGYTESAIPAALQKIVIDIASWYYKESTKGLLGITTIASSGGVGSSTTAYADMPTRFADALAPYKVII